jgi:predicted unusual protein kinase regulating ubiquinone biosynthesis (AarF/ABC1/UbiB family)
MSFLDVGIVAEEHRDEFQRELAKLRDAAPTVSFKQMKRVIEDDLEESLSEVFATFDEEPIAAASIGQVYKATLREDGREVAVKVQYPGVAGAVRADLQNLGMIMRLLKRMTPGMDVDAITQEIKERIVEELDYELEAQNQRSLARIFAGHPFIVVPDVVSSLSREHVLVSDFVKGIGFEELKTRPQPERDRVGEIVFRFFLGCLYRHRQFSGDPHPGNFLVMDDRRVAFLDFGLFKRMEAEPVELELACQRAVVEGDAAGLHAILAESGFLPEPERVNPDTLLAFIRDAIWWYTNDETVTLAPEIATQVMIESSDPRSSHFRQMRHQDMRPEHLFGRRMEVLTLAVLSQLRASANWHRIAREWMYGDEPVTELGREEAEFYGLSGVGAAG